MKTTPEQSFHHHTGALKGLFTRNIYSSKPEPKAFDNRMFYQKQCLSTLALVLQEHTQYVVTSVQCC